MSRGHWRWPTMLVAVMSSSALFVACASETSGASATTHKAGGVQFQAVFPSRVTTTTLTKAELAKSFSGVVKVVAATIFSVGIDASKILSPTNQVPTPNAFEVTVITFSSTSASKNYCKLFASVPGVKKETFDGRSAYGVIGNVATLNPGTPVPDKKATQGDLAVLDGKSVLVAVVETTAASTAASFIKTLKILY